MQILIYNKKMSFCCFRENIEWGFDNEIHSSITCAINLGFDNFFAYYKCRYLYRIFHHGMKLFSIGPIRYVSRRFHRMSVSH